jgi:nucleoside-diphosphate-sugar epimerase
LARLLILGAGYLGAALAERALAAGEEVVLADNWYATERAQLVGLKDAGAVVEQADIRRPEDLDRLLAHEVERVYLLAAQASRPLSEREPDYTEQTNLIGARRVAEAASRRNIPALVYASSLHVYGSPRGAVDADHPYGAQRDLVHLSKVYAELCLRMYAERAPLDLSILRLGIVYGPSPVEHRRPESQTVVDKFRHLAAAGSPLPLDDGGRATVGVVHVGDVARIMLESPSRSGVSIDNVAAETLTVADVAALARGEPAAGEPACTFRSRFTYEHGVAEYLRVATPQGPGG